ncbi:MAG TPA: ice-binding family protein [Candidatus Limnocylindria bacterium]|nr:ice-binding family protein [Candidatus Limnocylindria bacterium]
MFRILKLIGTLALTASMAVVMATSALAAPTSVGLGTAKSFAVLAGETITNTGPTKITGDIGLHPGSAVTGFSSVTYVGALHLADGVALQAKNALVTAYNDAAGRTPVTTIATELGGQVLKAGVYDSAAGTFGVTGTLTLDAEGDSQAVFIFQMASTLITAPASSVALINGASACNVFWQVGSSATLETTTSFKGTIMALTSIALKTGATLQGRALARNGAVTLDTNVITSAACAPPTAPTVPNTSLGGGGPLSLSLSLTMSLILIGTLAVMMSTALFGLARLGRPSGRGRR